MGGSVSDRQIHTDTHCPSHLLPPLLAAHEQTHLAILDPLCDKCVTHCLDFVSVCAQLSNPKATSPATHTHKVNTTSKFKHTHAYSYQTPPLALPYQHKQTHSYWSVWHYWVHFQFTDILVRQPSAICQMGNIVLHSYHVGKIINLDIFTHSNLFELVQISFFSVCKVKAVLIVSLCAQPDLCCVCCPAFVRPITKCLPFLPGVRSHPDQKVQTWRLPLTTPAGWQREAARLATVSVLLQ